MKKDCYPILKNTVRIKKMTSACWIVDLVADDGLLIHPFEAFALSLCTGEYTLENLRHIFSSVFRMETNNAFDTVLNKLEKYITWNDEISYNAHRYNPKTFLYDLKKDNSSSQLRFESPGEMTIILTHKCNFRCIYCFNSSGETKEVELNTKEWINVIEQARKLGVVKCTVSGGEPMLHPGFFDILKYLTDCGMAVYTCTNGSLIDEDSVRRFKEIGLTCIQFSLDAASSEVHDKMSAVKNTHHKVINSIKLLREAGIDVYIKSVLTPINYSNVSDLIDLCGNLGVKRLVLDRFDLSNAGRGNTNLFMTREQEIELAKLVEVKAKEIKGKMELVAVTIPRCWTSKEDLIVCGAFRQSLNILPNGDISVCEKLVGIPEMTAGNVRKNTLEEIWNSKNVNDILNPKKDGIEEPCKTCEFLSGCHTGCFALSLFVSKNPYSVDPRCWKGNIPNNPYIKAAYEGI
ncbi:radical SAM protein [Clostridium felsineum]|uniref:radical SAM/SPASM domain-containing protein n=1 Tax=Clostridium felsineum TaxID=36839 RepID=UPI00214D6578|nr:radical SAM protein [Clostridium felsineum]MCR3759687.1 radical SAM protein [Clostridium felsineum]